MNGGHLCELLAAMQSVYCGHFATLEVGAGQKQIVCYDGQLEFISSLINKHTTVDNSQLLFTCKVLIDRLAIGHYKTHLVTHLVWPHWQVNQPERPRA